MTDKKFKSKKKCPYCTCGNYRILNGWEWRSFSFHCLVICNYCKRTIHGYGITPKRALNKCLERLGKI